MINTGRSAFSIPEYIPTWHQEAIARNIDYIILVYHKADGFVFCPSDLEKPFRVEGDYNGSVPVTAQDALHYYQGMQTPAQRVRSPEFIEQVAWFIDFVYKIDRNEDFSLTDLHLTTRKVQIYSGRWPW
jgi:hypothetical protein